MRGTKSHDRTSPWQLDRARLLLARAATPGEGWQWHKMISIGDVQGQSTFANDDYSTLACCWVHAIRNNLLKGKVLETNEAQRPIATEITTSFET